MNIHEGKGLGQIVLSIIETCQPSRLSLSKGIKIIKDTLVNVPKYVYVKLRQYRCPQYNVCVRQTLFMPLTYQQEFFYM